MIASLTVWLVIPATVVIGALEAYYVRNRSVQLEYLCFTQYYNKNYDGCADE